MTNALVFQALLQEWFEEIGAVVLAERHHSDVRYLAIEYKRVALAIVICSDHLILRSDALSSVLSSVARRLARIRGYMYDAPDAVYSFSRFDIQDPNKSLSEIFKVLEVGVRWHCEMYNAAEEAHMAHVRKMLQEPIDKGARYDKENSGDEDARDARDAKEISNRTIYEQS